MKTQFIATDFLSAAIEPAVHDVSFLGTRQLASPSLDESIANMLLNHWRPAKPNTINGKLTGWALQIRQLVSILGKGSWAGNCTFAQHRKKR